MAKVNKRSSFKIWQDVIFALFLREIRSKFNDKLGLGWAVVQPVIFIIILSLMRGVMDGGETHTMPTFIFMAFGMSTILFFNATLNSISGVIHKNKALFAFRQVQPLSSVIASSILELFIQIFIYFVLVIIIYFMKFELEMNNALTLLLCIFQVWLISLSLGMIFALFICFIPELKKVKAIMMRPMIFVSGVFFSLQDIPPDMWKYFDWNPILHAIELSRQSAYTSFGAIGVSHEYLSIFTITIFFTALVFYRAFWKSAISQ